MESFTAELLTTTKNRPSLVVNGYQHRLFRKNAKVISWVCTKQKKYRCRGCVKTDLNNIVRSMTPHCCVINAEEIELKKTIEKLKKRVRDDIHSPVPEIFKEEICSNSLDKFSEKLQYSSIRTTLNRVRRKILRKKLNSWLPDNSEENNYLLPNENPEQVDCAVDYSPRHLMEENLCQHVQASASNLNLQVQNRTQCLPGKQKFTSNGESSKHMECSVDFHSSQFSANVEENQCQGGQVTNANKSLDTQEKHFSPGENFIKRENSHENSVVYHPNELVEQNNENNCQIVQVIDKHMNASKKRKLNLQEEQVKDYSVLQPDTVRKDEFHVFADYVASELRKLSPRALTLAKHNINNILFEANIGKYDSSSISNS